MSHAISNAIKTVGNVTQFVYDIEDNIQFLCKAIKEKDSKQNTSGPQTRNERILHLSVSIIASIGALLSAFPVIGGLLLGNIIVVIGATAAFIIFYDSFKVAENSLKIIGKETIIIDEKKDSLFTQAKAAGKAIIQEVKKEHQQIKNEGKEPEALSKDTILLSPLIHGLRIFLNTPVAQQSGQN